MLVYLILYFLIGVVAGAIIIGLYLHESYFNRELDNINRTHTMFWQHMQLEKKYNDVKKENEELRKYMVDKIVEDEGDLKK